MIYTFYSYKGGVGRSMALANVAELFYQAGLNVLMIDWDLEAPGLERFFPIQNERVLEHPGVINMLMDYKQRLAQPQPAQEEEEEREELPLLDNTLPLESIAPYLIDIYPEEHEQGKLWLLSAGQRAGPHLDEYASLIRTFDWQNFYQEWVGELFFEWFRQQCYAIADVILIDSRTGLSEMSGICTYQLADVVAMFCGANQQNLDGTYEMARNFKDPALKELRRERPLEVLIIPARVEDRAETERFTNFQQEFFEKFGEASFSGDYVLAFPIETMWKLKIPHVPFYAFNETVVVRESKQKRHEDMYQAFVDLGNLLASLAPDNSIIREIELPAAKPSLRAGLTARIHKTPALALRTDLAARIHKTSALIRYYEENERLVASTKEQSRLREGIELQKDLIKDDLMSYFHLARAIDHPIPDDIAEIAILMGIDLPPQDYQQATSSEYQPPIAQQQMNVNDET